MLGSRRQAKKLCPNMPIWMTTFADMTTLLLTFFVLMFTVSEIDGYELKLILSSFVGSFGVMEGGLTLQRGPLAEMGQMVESLPAKKELRKLDKAFQEAERAFKSELTARQIRMSSDERGLTISIPGQTYFEPDSWELREEGKKLMEKIGQLILNLKFDLNYDKQVFIEGHASLEPDTIEGQVGVSSIWERNLDLSTNRAKVIEKFFIKEYIDQGLKPVIELKGRKKSLSKFVSSGYGEFQPLESNDTPEERAWNRRVDIVIKR